VILLLIAVSYFIGSIPVAWIVTKLVTGQDLRQMGSGNVGVMNVGISVARWAGVLVFLAEADEGSAGHHPGPVLGRW
jgi:glycerol-3-phosphate acyltransferase PlsY